MNKSYNKSYTQSYTDSYYRQDKQMSQKPIRVSDFYVMSLKTS